MAETTDRTPDRTPDRTLGATARALLALLPAQALITLATLALPVLATVYARATGLPAGWIGYYSSLSTVGSMLAVTAATPLIRRMGPIRSSQVMLVLAAAGALLLLHRSLAACAASALVIGFGSGPANMAGSDLLNRVTPLRFRFLVFSVKQTSVPLGGILAGVALPLVAARAGWPAAVAAVAAACVVLLAAMQTLRARFDTERVADSAWRLSDIAGPLAFIRDSAAMRRLVAAAAVLSMVQFVFTSFYVTFLVDHVGLDVATAALLFGIGYGTGIFTRLGWGWLADRSSAELTLTIIAAATAAVCLVLPLLSAAWPVAAVAAVSIALGGTSASWNGVYLAEMARRAPDGQVPGVTAAGMLCLWCGALVGPSAFGALIALTGSGDLGFLLLAASAAGCAASLRGGRGGGDLQPRAGRA